MIRLRNIANINQETCSHMFRHRFITNIFINLIKQYDLENQDSFRNALMDVNNLKVHIQQLTGHKNLGSLDHYIHLAKSELTNMNGVLNKLDENRQNEAKEREQKRLLEELKNGNIDLTEYIKLMDSL
jgi:integrase